MAKTIKPDQLNAAISEQLGIYHEDIVDKVNLSSEEAIKKLVKKSKAKAPVRLGAFKRNIAWKLLEKKAGGNTYVWYVKAPKHRITHLLVHGHAKKTGGRTKPNPFLSDALAEVLPEYEKNIEEAIKQ